MTGVWNDKTIELFDDDSKPLWIEHPILEGNVDVVAIPIQIPNDCFTMFFMPGNDSRNFKLGIADNVNIIGFPTGKWVLGKFKKYEIKFPIWITGQVASEPDIDIGGMPYFYIESSAQSGNSGSPVVARSLEHNEHVTVYREHGSENHSP